MLRRFFAIFGLIFLFAFAQIGLVSHQISHLTESSQPSKQDQNTHSIQCAQCIGYAKAVDFYAVTPFLFTPVKIGISKPLSIHLLATLRFVFYFSARAPPVSYLN